METMENQSNNIKKEIVLVALNLLEYEDVFPQVGIGMNYRTAVFEAVEVVKSQALTFGLTLEVDSSIIDSAVNEVAERRSYRIR